MRPSSIRTLHAALSGWLVGLLAVGPAAAQPTLPARLMPRALSTAAAESTVTVVAMALDAAARAEAPRLAYLAEQEVARSGRLRLVRLADALDEGGRREREARAAEAAAAMKDGQRAYDELDTQQALQQFDRAVRAAEAADLSLRFGDLSRARVMKAASQVANGENTAAQLEIRAVLAVDPRAQFSPNFFPPDQMAFVEKERKAVLAAPKSSLVVRTEPVPAQVFVDGVFRGVSPVEVTDLPPADHYVTVLAPGHALAQRRARSGDTTLTLEPVAAQQPLRVLTETVARKPRGAERDRALRELGALAGTSQVLALLVSGGAGAAPLEVTALRLDVADGHNLAYALGTVPRGDGMDAGSRELLARLVSADAPRQGGKPVTHFSSGSASRRTLGYVMVATGVALLAGGIYFGMEASAKEDDFRRAVQNSPRAQDIRDTGKTYALVADIGIVAGLVSAGLGGYFAFSGGGGGGRAPTPSRPGRAEPPPSSKREPLPMPPPPSKAARPQGESLPMPPPPRAQGESLPMPPPPARATPPPASRQEDTSAPPRAPDDRRSRQEEERRREEELRKRREEVERQRRELEEQRKKEEAEAARKREEAERRRREEEEKKKRPALDEDDLRNY